MSMTRYTFDPSFHSGQALASGLTQVLADGTHSYLYGNGRIAQYTGTTPEYFLADALGSVRQLTDASGSVTLAKGYQPYGEVLESAGSGSSAYGFTGEWTDSSGMVYLRARYYSPAQGRFMTRDTWGGKKFQPISYNAWLYSLANPVRFVDPSGYVACELLPPEDQAACQEANAPEYPQFGTSGWEKILPRNITWNPSSDPFIKGAKGIPPDTNRAQYLNSKKGWTGGSCLSPSRGGSDYCNLCGQIAVAAILRNIAGVDISVQDVMSDYESLGYDNYGTSWAEGIGNLMTQKYASYFKDVNYKWRWWRVAVLPNDTGSWRWVYSGVNGDNQPYLRSLNDMMLRLFKSRQFPIAAVMINSEGFIDTPYWGYSMTGHWVVLTGISNEFDRDDGQPMRYNGDTPQMFWKWRWVRVYNPFDNQTEYYPLQHFLDSCCSP